MRLLPILALALLPIGAAIGSTSYLSTSDDKLSDSMKVLGKNQRTVKKLIKDVESNERELLETLGAMEDAVLVGLGRPSPPAPKGVEGKDAELFEIGYRRTLVSLLDTTLHMQAATLEGDADALAEGY